MIELHRWTNSPHIPWTYCKACGAIKAEESKPCKGPVTIKLRETHAHS